MSIELHEEGGGRILVVEMSGILRNADCQQFVLKAEQLIKEHGKLRILCKAHNFAGWETGTFQKEQPDNSVYDFELKHFADVERVAFVGDEAWEQTWAAFRKPFAAAEVRYFKDEQSGEARRWMYDDLPFA
jgi:hypothetical protein